MMAALAANTTATHGPPGGIQEELSPF